MALIYQKFGADQLLLLDSREALVYPFNVGNWSEIRCAVAVSFTDTSGNNNIPPTTTIPTNSPKNAFHFGLKNSGQQFILGANCSFWGYSTLGKAAGSNATCFVNNGGGSTAITVQDDAAGYYIFTNNTTCFASGQNGGVGFQTAQPLSSQTGTTNFAVINGLKFILNGNTYNGTFFSDNANNQAGTNVVDITGMRLAAASLGHNAGGGTGFWTSNGTITGTALPAPNALFIYMPFFDIRMRIHALLIESYA